MGMETMNPQDKPSAIGIGKQNSEQKRFGFSSRPNTGEISAGFSAAANKSLGGAGGTTS